MGKETSSFNASTTFSHHGTGLKNIKISQPNYVMTNFDTNETIRNNQNTLETKDGFTSKQKNAFHG